MYLGDNCIHLRRFIVVLPAKHGPLIGIMTSVSAS